MELMSRMLLLLLGDVIVRSSEWGNIRIASTCSDCILTTVSNKWAIAWDEDPCTLLVESSALSISLILMVGVGGDNQVVEDDDEDVAVVILPLIFPQQRVNER